MLRNELDDTKRELYFWFKREFQRRDSEIECLKKRLNEESNRAEVQECLMDEARSIFLRDMERIGIAADNAVTMIEEGFRAGENQPTIKLSDHLPISMSELEDEV